MRKHLNFCSVGAVSSNAFCQLSELLQTVQFIAFQRQSSCRLQHSHICSTSVPHFHLAHRAFHCIFCPSMLQLLMLSLLLHCWSFIACLKWSMSTNLTLLIFATHFVHVLLTNVRGCAQHSKILCKLDGLSIPVPNALQGELQHSGAGCFMWVTCSILQTICRQWRILKWRAKTFLFQHSLVPTEDKQMRNAADC